MPNYTYLCSSDSCQQELTVLHSMGESPVLNCPDCKTAMAKKIEGQTPAILVRGAPKKHRITIKETGDPVVDHVDADITERLHHELIVKNRGKPR